MSDLSKFFSSIIKNLPSSETAFSEISKLFRGTAPAMPASPNTGEPQPAGPAADLGLNPDEVIRAMQKAINQWAPPDPPLDEDGKYGKLTKAALRAVLVKYGFMPE